MPSIKITLYGQTKEFETRTHAKLYLLEALGSCDPRSSEHERYYNAYMQLIAGKTNVSDEDVKGE